MVKHKIVRAGAIFALLAGAVMPMGAFADGAEDVFCVEGGKCYGTLQEAFNAVPRDGTQATVYLNGDSDTVYDGGGAFYAKDGEYNVVFDLKGKTYVISQSPVGSKGYETQSFHVEKGGKFVLKNGTVKASTDSGVKMIFQNYADTTFEDVVLDASENSNISYVASNNFGSLTVKGKSGIIASDGQVAFDLWYGMNKAYCDGVNVTFDESFTGKVDGIVEYGRSSKACKDVEDWRDRAALKFQGGEFDISLRNGSSDALNGANIEISGGTFANRPELEYMAEGMNAYSLSDDGPWVVDEDAILWNYGEYDVVPVGGTYELEFNEIARKYATVGSTDPDKVSVNGNVLTVKGVGKTAITMEMHDLREQSRTFSVYGFAIGDDSADFHTVVVVDGTDEDHINDEYLEALKAEAGDSEILAYYEIDVKMRDEKGTDWDTDLYVNDSVSKMGVMLPVTIELPADLPAVADGMTRKFYVIRCHVDDDNIETAKIEVTDNGDGTGTFYNDKFSTFALVYEDVAETPETPETGMVQRQGASVALSSVVLAALAGIVTTVASFVYFMNRVRK